MPFIFNGIYVISLHSSSRMVAACYRRRQRSCTWIHLLLPVPELKFLFLWIGGWFSTEEKMLLFSILHWCFHPSSPMSSYYYPFSEVARNQQHKTKKQRRKTNKISFGTNKKTLWLLLLEKMKFSPIIYNLQYYKCLIDSFLVCDVLFQCSLPYPYATHNLYLSGKSCTWKYFQMACSTEQEVGWKADNYYTHLYAWLLEWGKLVPLDLGLEETRHIKIIACTHATPYIFCAKIMSLKSQQEGREIRNWVFKCQKNTWCRHTGRLDVLSFKNTRHVGEDMKQGWKGWLWQWSNLTSCSVRSHTTQVNRNWLE